MTYNKTLLKEISKINKENYKNSMEWDYVNYLDTGNLTENKIDKVQRIDLKADKLPSRAKRIPSVKNILYSTVRPNQRHYGFINKETIPNLLVSTGFVVLEIDEDKANPKYVYYYLIQDSIINMLQNIGETSTSAYPSVKVSDIENIELNLPTLSEQEAIADILSSFDNKIKNNNAIIANLEEQAQTIFKSWFIDFEPFQDEEFVDTELGEIPKRFKLGTMNDLISEVTSGDWGKKEPTGNYIEEVYCIRGADIPKVNIGEMGSPAKRFINKNNIEKKTLNPYDITIEISGGSPTQSTGRSTIINKNIINKFDNPIVCTNFCKKISSHSKYEAVFLYSYLQYLYGNDMLFMYENGTTGIKNLDYKVLFNKHEIAIPPISKLKEYFSIFDNIWTYLQHLGILNAKLAEIRDMLLPKLMSGEIRVEEAIEVE